MNGLFVKKMKRGEEKRRLPRERLILSHPRKDEFDPWYININIQ